MENKLLLSFFKKEGKMSLTVIKRTNYRIRKEKNKNIEPGISGEFFIPPP